ncbi:cytochrome P450 monooxygenase-like protein 15 [Elsinoe australis]|uniref:Cytochrome P450 monooxygenase-like protein 15 n=1 Tax=Elsinoe australis TaxID=40998 RepID=A0A4U7B9G0_9PEZI|nr:cytochrome P450 monooxygenase-like protein 15 [Elsinoe australis]
MAGFDVARELASLTPKKAILLLVGTYFLYSFLRIFWRGQTSPLRHLPGPWYTKYTHYVLMWKVMIGQRDFYINDLHNKYGQTVRTTPHEADFMDADSYRKIHHVSSKFIKDPWYEAVNFLPRPSIFHARDPKDHGERRKALAKNFTVAHLRTHFDPMVRELCVRTVEKIVLRAKRDGETDLLDWARLACSDILGKTVFGETFGMIENEKRNNHIRVLDNALLFGGFTSEMPWLRTVASVLPIKVIQEAYNSVDYIVNGAQPAVDHARSSTLSNQKTILASCIQDQIAGKDKGVPQWDDLQIKIEALTLLIAGSGATATVLGFCWWQLLEQPDLLRRLEEEVAALPPDFDDKMLEDRCPLLEATLHETNRLWAGVPSSLPRVAPPEGCTLDGYAIPPGTTVCTQAYSMHRDPVYWEDPMKFDPSRFLPGAKVHKDARSILSGFGAGAYACLGINLAKMKMRYMTAMLLRQCRGMRLHEKQAPLKEENLVTWIAIFPKSNQIWADFKKVDWEKSLDIVGEKQKGNGTVPIQAKGEKKEEVEVLVQTAA